MTTGDVDGLFSDSSKQRIDDGLWVAGPVLTSDFDYSPFTESFDLRGTTVFRKQMQDPFAVDHLAAKNLFERGIGTN